MSQEPRRLLEETASPPSLQAALKAARQEGPSADQARAVSLGLGGLLDRPIDLTPKPAAASGAAAAKIGGLVAVVVALGATGAYVASRSAPAVPGTLGAGAPAAAREVANAALNRASKPEPSAAAEVAAEAPAALPAASSPRAPTSAAAPGASSGPSELVLLERARAALANEPARALALTNEHRRRFPHGALAEEREVIAIRALEKLGRGKEAAQRGSAFEQQNPDSIHRRTVTEKK
ncbi:MAG: hypothetical protein U0263_04220 [Polyangiaceae bacterium]